MTWFVWFDPDKKKCPGEKLREGAARYRRVRSAAPTVALVAPAMFEDQRFHDAATALGIEARQSDAPQRFDIYLGEGAAR